MEPDDLLCSRNARSRLPSWTRAVEINQPHPGEIPGELGESIYFVRRCSFDGLFLVAQHPFCREFGVFEDS